MKTLSKKNQWKLEKFWDYLGKNPEIKIIKLNLSSSQMRSLFDKDVHDYWSTSTVAVLSEMIQEFLDLPTSDIDQFNDTDSGDWSHGGSNYLIYQLFKISWLKKDIKKNGIQAPVQLLKTVESYHCHPGSDKKYALTILDTHEVIPCFYIHYPDIDPYPFYEYFDHTVVTTMEEFADMFEKAEDDSFNFEWGKVEITRSPDSKVGDHPQWKAMDHFYAFAYNNAEIFRKKEMRTGIAWQDNYSEFLSYHDSVHRRQMDKEKDIIKNIYLIDEKTFNLNGDLFDLIPYGDKEIWLPRSFNNFPSSLIDTAWKNNSLTSLKFSLDYMVDIKGEM